MLQTAKVFVRHSADCPDRKKGPDWRRCNCRKSFIAYDGVKRNAKGDLSNKIVSAKTRSWGRAEQAAQEWLDALDPQKAELKRLRAEKEIQQVRIEDAVALFIEDMIGREVTTSSVSSARSLFGHVDPDTKEVLRPGHLFAWLDRQNPRPVFIADLTPTHVTRWRASWRFKSDLTTHKRWGMAKAFFRFCEGQRWVDNSPASRLPRLKPIKKGNRTTIFTDAQYDAVLSTISVCDMTRLPREMRTTWRERLTAFLELARWSGMDMIDCAQFTPEQLDANDVLRYERRKTGVSATILLPERAVTALRNIPLAPDAIDNARPFRLRDCTLESSAKLWARRLESIFKQAGITAVTTDHRTRSPHVKMLRHTFAVWHLRHGAALRTVSKMLGHTKTSTTELHYLPWVPELELAHIEDTRKSLSHIPKRPQPSNVVAMRHG